MNFPENSLQALPPSAAALGGKSKRKEEMTMTYQAPEILEIGNAVEVVLGELPIGEKVDPDLVTFYE
jgi:hypothetical protein